MPSAHWLRSGYSIGSDGSRRNMTKTAIITGASAGIGRALALELANRGYHLGLTSRRLAVLESLRTEILTGKSSGRRVEIAALDVDDHAEVATGLQNLCAALGDVDIVVVNAGVNVLTKVGAGQWLKEAQILQTNVLGALATVSAAAQYFGARGSGQIVGISSLASLMAIPTQAAYCASKAAFSMYLDSARMELRDRNVCVTDIRPGFVLTEIVPDIGKYPFAVSAEQAAREMADVIEARKDEAVVPAYPWRWCRPFLPILPEAIIRRII